MLLLAAAHAAGGGSLRGWLVLAAAAVAGVIAYRWSLRRHPWTRCRRCAGSARHTDPVWTYAFGNCRRCGGTGRKPRLGTRLLHLDQ